jgi:hypothetical protein
MVVEVLVTNEMFMSRVEKALALGWGDLKSRAADVDRMPPLELVNGDGDLACKSRP